MPDTKFLFVQDVHKNEEIPMTAQVQTVQGEDQVASRPVLTLVPDIYNPDQVMAETAQWYFNYALGYAGSDEQAAEQVARSFRQVLWLVENPFNEHSKIKHAVRVFHEMKTAYEMIYGQGNLPQKVYGWAKALGLFTSPVVAPVQVDPVAAAAKRAEAERKRKERSAKDRNERNARKGPAGGGGGKKSAK